MLLVNALTLILMVPITLLALVAVVDAEPASIRSWISALGPFFGLLGLATVAFLNAYLNRIRDDRLRQEASIQIINAVQAELAFIKLESGVLEQTLQGTMQQKTYLGTGISTVLRFSETLVYHSNLEKLGILSFELNAKLVEVYNMVGEHNRGVSGYTESQLDAINKSDKYYAMFLSVAQDRLQTIRSHSEDALNALEKEKQAQQRRASVPYG